MSATPRPRLRLRREQRLRAGGDFVRLKEDGHRQVYGCLILNWQPMACDKHSFSKVGVITSKSLGCAVVRNRARRLLKEVFRRYQHDLTQPVMVVLVARRSIVGRSYFQVETDFRIALRQARLLTETLSNRSASTP